MTSNTLLLGALGMFFVALLVALLTFAVPSSPRRAAVARSLALAERMGTRQQQTTLVEDLSFFDRVLAPLFTRLSGLGRWLSPQGYVGWVHRALDRAGNPGRWTVERVFGVKAIGMLGLGIVGLLYGTSLGGLAGTLLVPVLGAAVGFYLPDLLIYNTSAKRQKQIEKSLAEAIDMLTVCVEAGLGFDAALVQVGRNTDGPLAREIARTLQEIQLGTARTEALRALAERNPVADLQAFVGAIVQAESLGIPIAGILREQSKEMRSKRRQRAEEQAQKVPVKILFPMLLFIFPALMIVVIGPGAISAYHSFTGG